MRVALLVVMAIVLAGCTRTRDLDDLYIFGKHDSTGFCFFGEDWNDDGAIDAGTAGYVPCTPEVEKWIADRRKTT